MADPPRDPFTDLLTKLVRVPKEEIDAQERKRETAPPRSRSKPRQMVQRLRPKRKAG